MTRLSRPLHLIPLVVLPLSLVTAGCLLSAGTGAGGDGPDAGPDSGPTLAEGFVPACEGASRRLVPAPLDAPGGADVGALTLELPRFRLEVWYPARPGAAAGVPPRIYDIRQALAPAEAEKVSDAQNPWQPCDCAEGLPLDDAGGPLPLVVFVHGTAAFRHQSLGLATHLASRGFVVAAADHPGLYLADTLALVCGYEPTGSRDLRGDVQTVIDTLRAAEGPLGFLAGRVDFSHIGLVGHSAGGSAVASAADLGGVKAVASLAGNTPVRAEGVQSLFLAALEDAVVPADRSRAAFDQSVGSRAYLALAGSGHLAFSDLCETRNAAGQNLLEVGREVELCGASLAGLLFDCDPDYVPQSEINPPFHAAVTATLESALLCAPADLEAALADFSAVAEFVTVSEDSTSPNETPGAGPPPGD